MINKTILLLVSVFFLILPDINLQQTSVSGKDLMFYTNSAGRIRKVKSDRQWDIKRNQILDAMQMVMGRLPGTEAKVPADMVILTEERVGDIRRLRITFASGQNDRIPAYLLIPGDLKNPVPGILCLHQTTDIGKGEPAGLGGNPDLHYALELAARGFVTLAPDYPGFGEYDCNPYEYGYVSATMKGIWNHMVAVDLLQSLPEVDPHRIGCIGHSLGGHNTLFLAAFDERIKVAVTSCGFTSFSKYYGGDLTGWSHEGYMPLIAEKYEENPEKMPFDFPEVLAAIAPRALFINAPVNDSNFEISGVFDCYNTAKPVYRFLSAEARIKMKNPVTHHTFPSEIRKEAYEFIELNLRPDG